MLAGLKPELMSPVQRPSLYLGVSLTTHLLSQNEEGLLEFFETVVSLSSASPERDAEAVALLLRMDIKGLLNERNGTFNNWYVLLLWRVHELLCP